MIEKFIVISCAGLGYMFDTLGISRVMIIMIKHNSKLCMALCNSIFILFTNFDKFI